MPQPRWAINRKNSRRSAGTTSQSRRLLVERRAVMGNSEAAEVAVISTLADRKWLARFHCLGKANR